MEMVDLGYWIWLLEGNFGKSPRLAWAIPAIQADIPSGEATLCILEWEAASKGALGVAISKATEDEPTANAPPAQTRGPFIPPNARRTGQSRTLFASNPPSLPSRFSLQIEATDPVRLPSTEITLSYR